MPKKVALLDVDGTLVDSNDAHAQAWLDAFAHFGHELAYKRVRELIGKGGDKLMPEAIGVETIRLPAKRLRNIHRPCSPRLRTTR